MKDRFCLRNRPPARGPHVITYSATLDVPAETATLLTELLIAERLRRGTGIGARAASARDQAILVLRWFRQVALTWAGVECSPSRWSAQRWLRRPDAGRWPPKPQVRLRKADFARALLYAWPLHASGLGRV